MSDDKPSVWNVEFEAEDEDGEKHVLPVRYRKLTVVEMLELRKALADNDGVVDIVDWSVERAKLLLRNEEAEWSSWPLDAFVQAVQGHPFLFRVEAG